MVEIPYSISQRGAQTKKQMTVLSVSKHLTKESKKKEEKKTVQRQKEPELVPEKLKKFAEFYKVLLCSSSCDWKFRLKAILIQTSNGVRCRYGIKPSCDK